MQLSITDAMGHDVRAALLATSVVGALRRARRAGAGLLEQARQADQGMREHSAQGYVTGQLLRIGLRDGQSSRSPLGSTCPSVFSPCTPTGSRPWTCDPATGW